jgi:hypothetical protein
MRKEIRYLIGTRQIFLATVRAISFKGWGIVLSDVNLNNTIVEHMNIFPHSFRRNKNFKIFKKSIKIGDIIKLEGRVSDYNKIEDGIEVTDYCLRDINILKINYLSEDEEEKKVCTSTRICSTCGKIKKIEVFENKNTNEQVIKCTKECDCDKQYDIKYKYINGELNITKTVKKPTNSNNYGRYIRYSKPSFNGMINNMITFENQNYNKTN